jgi:multidrug resistance efflux pump
MSTEIRKRKRSIGPYVYLGILFAFALWVVDVLFGDMIYVRADGIVLQDKVVVATEFIGTVTALAVDDGSRVIKGQPIAQLQSQEVDERLAKLSSDFANALALTGQAKVQSGLNDATENIAQALRRLTTAYADGLIRSPADGIVSNRQASVGSVVVGGQPLLELYVGTPYILAYVPDGALYELRAGDPIQINVGLDRYFGHVSDVRPVYSKLPEAFVSTFQSVKRGRVIKIAFEAGQPQPTLFANATIKTRGTPPAWLKRKLSRAS